MLRYRWAHLCHRHMKVVVFSLKELPKHSARSSTYDLLAPRLRLSSCRGTNCLCNHIVVQAWGVVNSNNPAPPILLMAGPSQPRLRHRRPSAEPPNLDFDQVQDDEHVGEIFQNPVRVCLSWRATYNWTYPKKNRNLYEQLLETPKGSMIVVSILTSLAFALRFYKINHPDQVV
jgi:hypothetical protein